MVFLSLSCWIQVELCPANRVPPKKSSGSCGDGVGQARTNLKFELNGASASTMLYCFPLCFRFTQVSILLKCSWLIVECLLRCVLFFENRRVFLVFLLCDRTPFDILECLNFQSQALIDSVFSESRDSSSISWGATSSSRRSFTMSTLSLLLTACKEVAMNFR